METEKDRDINIQDDPLIDYYSVPPMPFVLF